MWTVSCEMKCWYDCINIRGLDIGMLLSRDIDKFFNCWYESILIEFFFFTVISAEVRWEFILFSESIITVREHILISCIESIFDMIHRRYGIYLIECDYFSWKDSSITLGDLSVYSVEGVDDIPRYDQMIEGIYTKDTAKKIPDFPIIRWSIDDSEAYCDNRYS